MLNSSKLTDTVLSYWSFSRHNSMEIFQFPGRIRSHVRCVYSMVRMRNYELRPFHMTPAAKHSEFPSIYKS